MRFFILLLCCGLSITCSPSDPIFPLEEILTQDLMPLQGVTCPELLEVKHPFLILQNDKRTDSLFHIYDLNNYELKSAFGTIGQGPNDILGPWLFATQLSDLLINDVLKKVIYQFGINEQGQPVLKDIKKPKFIGNISDAAFINDSLYVVDARILAPSLYLFYLTDELPQKTRKYRNMKNYMIDPDIAEVFANENRIALCYGYKKQIDFMDTDLNLIKRVKFKYVPSSFLSCEDRRKSYSTGYLGKRYLYALFLGTEGEIYADLSFRDAVLEVFDLDGNPVIKYRFDGLFPSRFVIDENTFTLYGCRFDGQPEDYLLVYKLKGLS